jgi:hypothetical protein
MGSATEFAGSGDKSFRFPNAQGQCEVKHKKINCYSNNRAKLPVRTFDAGFCPIQQYNGVPSYLSLRMRCFGSAKASLITADIRCLGKQAEQYVETCGLVR